MSRVTLHLAGDASSPKWSQVTPLAEQFEMVQYDALLIQQFTFRNLPSEARVRASQYINIYFFVSRSGSALAQPRALGLWTVYLQYVATKKGGNFDATGAMEII